MTKLRVAVIMGGTNTEHEVSLSSAKGILANLDHGKYDVLPLTITKDNRWLNQDGQSFSPSQLPQVCDVVFPVLHGPYGEDGTLQGMLEMFRLPYVGCGVAASAICMDKVMQKDLCQTHSLPQVSYLPLFAHEWEQHQPTLVKRITSHFQDHYPLFVKPANQGSSVGVSKVKSVAGLIPAIHEAFTRDSKLIIEQGVENAREIECSVLGPHYAPEASVLGEIIPHAEFYDYDTKYLNDNSEALIPAQLDHKLADSIRETARLAYQVLGCDGLTRVDFLLDPKSDKYYLNELNTLPGFTPISMYPKLWEASGLAYPQLLDRLLELALDRQQRRQQLNFSRE